MQALRTFQSLPLTPIIYHLTFHPNLCSALLFPQLPEIQGLTLVLSRCRAAYSVPFACTFADYDKCHSIDCEANLPALP